ncbi:MAG: hypothetical protein CSB49_08790 [Proteobacteria bacterium]|nr:MAG: hypothetical protein CSB49_08790 [Pseudomonadota bacterium]
MDFDTPRREKVAINLSALIDIAFILVIFVVLAASFQRIKSIDVALPRADAESPTDPKSLVVQVPPQGVIRIAGRAVAPERVKSALASLRKRYASVLIVADRQASVERAIRVLAAAQGAGFAAAGIATERPTRGN